MNPQKIKEFYINLGDLEFENHTLNKLFNIDNIPIYWFFQKRLISGQAHPIFETHEQLAQNLKKVNLKSVFSKLLYLSFILKNFGKKKVCKGKTNKKKIGVLIHTNAIHPDGKIDRIQQLLRQLDNSEIIEWIPIIIEPLAQISFKKPKLPNHLSSFIKPDLKKKSKILAKHFNKKWRNLKPPINDEKLKIWNLTKPNLDFFYSVDHLKIIFEMYFGFQNAIKTLNLEACILYAPGGQECRALMAACKKLKKPSILVPHGMSAPKEKWDLLDNTYVFAQNEFIKKQFLELGANKKNIIKTGLIGFEKQQVSKPDPKKPVLLLTAPLVEDSYIDEKTYINHLTKTIGQISAKRNLIIKKHPLESAQRIKKIIGDKFTFIETNLEKTKLNELIKNSSAVVCFFSSCIIDALNQNRPVILLPFCLDKLVQEKYLEQFTHPLFFRAKDKDIGTILEHAIKQSQKTKPCQSEYVFFPEEGIPKRMEKEIKKILNLG